MIPPLAARSPAQPETLVIDIGGTHIKFAAAGRAGRRRLDRYFPTDALCNDDPIGSLAGLIRQAMAELAFTPEAIVSTIPGFLAPDRDLVRFAGNILQLNGRRVKSELQAKLGLPVILERDSIMLLRGEWAAGAGQGAAHLLGIFFGTGVGAAYLEHGVPFRGAGYALEIGHLPFRGDGRILAGMRTDSLEAYVSGRVLRSIAERHGVPVAAVFARAQDSEELAREVLQFIHDLAITVGIGVALFSPDAIVLGGGLCAMEGFPRDDVAGLIAENAPFDQGGRPMDLRWASLGWEAALHGAQVTAAEAMSAETT